MIVSKNSTNERCLFEFIENPAKNKRLFEFSGILANKKRSFDVFRLSANKKCLFLFFHSKLGVLLILALIMISPEMI